MVLPVLTICVLLLPFLSKELSNSAVKSKFFNSAYFVLGVILCFIIANRSPLTSDYVNYQLFYDSGVERFETGFVFLGENCKKIGLTLIDFFFVCAFIAITIKFYAIIKMTRLVFASLFIYISNAFILQENIQVRCAIASAFVLLSIYYSVEKQLVKFLLTVSLAVLFHNTAIIVFPLWFVSNSAKHLKYYVFLIPLAYILFGLGFTFGRFIQYIPIPPIQNFWSYYIVLLDRGIGHVEINVFNALQLTKCVFCFILYFYTTKIASSNKYFVVCLKIYIISLFLYVVFSDFPVAADRLSEFLSIVEIILLPCLLWISKNKQIGWSLIAFWSSTHLFVHIVILQHLL